MLQNIRDNAQGTIAKVIVGLIVITFALFGVESIVGSLSGEPEVASVNGESVTEYQFQRQLERQRRQVINQMGENYDPSMIDENQLRAATLESIIVNEVQRQTAEEKGLTVADATVDQFILSWPPAQQDGRFNREQFQSVLRNIGLSALDFRNELKKEMMIGQLRSAVSQTSFVLDSELDELLRIERQKRTFKFLELNASKIAENIVVDVDAINLYYTDNQSSFELPERVRLDYIEIKKADLVKEITVDDAEVRSQYEQQISDFSVEEQRRAAHILLEITDKTNEDELLAKANKVKARLDMGESFSELAKSESGDIGSAQQGGDLGFVTKGSLGPEFDAALFSLELGQVSEPVLTEYGYHLIKVNEISKLDPPSFEESEKRIRAALELQKAEDLFIEYSTSVADLTYSAADLVGPAKELGVSVKTSKPIPRSGGDGVFSNPAVLNQAFSEEVVDGKHNSEVVEVNRDTLLVLRLNEYLPAQVQPLADVEARISEQLKLKEAKQQLAEKTAELVESAKLGQFNSFGDEQWQEADKVGRNQPDLGAAVRFAFGMPVPPAQGIVAERFDTDNGYVIVAVTEVVEEQAEALSAAERQAFRAFLSNQVGSQEYRNYSNKLQAIADIERI